MRGHHRRTLLLVVLLGMATVTRSVAQNAASLVGNWSGHDAEGSYILILNADGKGSLNAAALQWSYSAGRLRLMVGKDTYTYGASSTPTSLTLSGNNLPQPLVFQRVDAAAAEAAAKLGSASGSDQLPIAGHPPLTQAMVDTAVRLYEWLLDAKLTQEQRGQFQDSVIHSWTTQNQAEIAGTLSILKFHDDLGRKSEAERNAVREVLLTKYLEEMRKAPNAPLAQWVLGIYYAAHTPIAVGNPPLTRQVADAYAEVNCFMISEVMGPQAFQPGKDFKDRLAKSLAVQWPGLGAARQKEMSQLPVIWAAIQLGWPGLSAAERAQYRAQWTPSVRAMLAPAATNNAPASAAATPPRAGSSDAYRKVQERMMVDRMLSNMNQDYIHRYVLSSGWSYRKYVW